MSIFGKTNTITPTKNPYLGSFTMESFDYNLLKDLEYESFSISLEFNRTVYTGFKHENIEIVNEGFNDFFKKAAEFFRNLGKKIMEFATNYAKYFVSYFNDFRNFLSKNAEYLRSLNVDFDYNGYEFDFSKKSPDLTKVYDIVSSYNTEINKIDTMTFADINKLRDEFVNNDYKNKIRASILNNGDHEITEDSFNQKSKELFRKSTDHVILFIDNKYIDKIIREYNGLKTLLDETERSKVKILKMLNDLEIFFDKKASVTYDKQQKIIKTSTIDTSDDNFKKDTNKSINYNTEKLKILNSFFDLKYKESRFISNCVVTVYIDKVNAINDCMKQYRSIVRRALNKHEKNYVEDTPKKEVNN